MTAKRVVAVKVPVSRFALVADATLDFLFTLTQQTNGHNATAAKWVARNLLGASRVAVAHWKHISLIFTLWPLTLVKLSRLSAGWAQDTCVHT